MGNGPAEHRPQCTVGSCERPRRGDHGLCSMHRKRQRRHGSTKLPQRSLPVERIWLKVSKEPGPCWEWTGATTRGGYGLMSVGNVRKYTHRIAYELAIGPIPADRVLDHLCRNRRCCNPEHLEAVGDDVNCYRGLSLPAINHRKVKCSKGHAFTPENTIVKRNGRGRACRKCRNAWRATRRAAGLPN